MRVYRWRLTSKDWSYQVISEQMPGVSPDRWQEVDRLLELALDTPEEERSSLLDRACGGDPKLRQLLQELLDAERASGSFLEESIPARLGVTEDLLELGDQPTDSSAGQQIGAYRLERQIGRGGMGEVWLARRVDGEFEHTVAIKLLDARADSAASRERLRRERQMLAGLDHPNIARLLDGGTLADGRPYFVMECIDGEPIDHYCARRSLPLVERLRLVLELTEAVASAHRQGMIHRDLKPSNVLVTPEGAVKLVDFGIAKKVRTEQTGLTLTGLTLTGQRPMTPEYASPEQVRGEEVTTTTDIYGLGALCYELATGRRPFAFTGQPIYALEQAVCELRIRPPSEAVAFGSPRQITLPGGATYPLSPPEAPRRLRRLLESSLDRLLTRALSKDASRRHASVEEFAAEMEDALARISGRSVRTMPSPVRILRWALPAALLLVLTLALIGGPATIHSSTPWSVRLPQMDEILQTTVPAPGPRLLFLPFNAEGTRHRAMTFLLTKALWTTLGHRRDLQMVGERSALELRESSLGRSTQSLAAAVDAAFVLSGRTLGEGPELRLETQLHWAVDGRALWSKRYPLEGAAFTKILDDIVAATSLALGLSAPTPGQSGRFLVGWDTARDNWPSDAALRYAAAWYLSTQGPDHAESAEQYLLRALQDDPSMAPGWTLLARLRRPRFEASEDLTHQFLEAIQRALDLDPKDHLAHLTLANVHLQHTFDLAAASDPLLSSLRELPMFTPTLSQATSLAAASGDLDAAVTLAQRAARLDPLDASDQLNAAHLLHAAGRLDEAMDHLEVARVLEPQSLALEYLRSRVLLSRGQLEMAREVAALEASAGFRNLGLVLTEFALGNEAASTLALDELIATESETFAFQIAQAHACRGELDEALQWLHKAFELRDAGLIAVRREPCFYTWREDHRLRDLVNEMLPLPSGSQRLEISVSADS